MLLEDSYFYIPLGIIGGSDSVLSLGGQKEIMLHSTRRFCKTAMGWAG